MKRFFLKYKKTFIINQGLEYGKKNISLAEETCLNIKQQILAFWMLLTVSEDDFMR